MTSVIKDINIDKFRENRQIVEENGIKSSILLKDGRVVTCNSAFFITIYDPQNYYHRDVTLKAHSDEISTLCQLENEYLVSCSHDKTIKFWKIEKKEIKCLFTIEDNNKILGMVILPENRIATCGLDHSIKIWKSDEPYEKSPIKVIESDDSCITLVYIKEKDQLFAGFSDDTIRSFDMKTYAKVNEIKVDFITSNILPLEKDKLICSHYSEVKMIDLSNNSVTDVFKDDSQISDVGTIKMLRDGHTVVMGAYEEMGIFDVTTGKFVKIPTNQNLICNDILIINDSTFLTANESGTIKVWKY